MSRPVNDRITELEVQLAHVQRLYEQLNEVVTAQAMASDRMARRVAELSHQVKDVKRKQDPTVDPLDEKPPHY